MPTIENGASTITNYHYRNNNLLKDTMKGERIEFQLSSAI